MKKEKNELYFNRILTILLTEQICSVIQLAEYVSLSEKTVRTKLNQLNDWLKSNHLGVVYKKQGTGIWLEASTEQRRRIKAQLEFKKREGSLGDLENRHRQVIGKLLRLKPGGLVTLQQLADSLYLSAPTVANIVKEVAPWFEKHSLSIKSIRNKGISLVGDEYNYRIAIKDYLMDMMPEALEALLYSFASGVDIYHIRRIIVNAENAWRIELADHSFTMAWILVSLSLGRAKAQGELRFQENQEENIQYYVEYSFAESIYQRIGKEFQRELPHNDIVLLAIMLISAKRMNTILDISSEDYAGQYDENLQNFVRSVIETIDSVLDAGLIQDEILFESLLIHMRSAIFRMKYSTAILDSISKYVKNEYKQTFLATWSTSYLFEEQYGIQVTEDELAGITLYIQAALIRQKKERPLSAILVSQNGQATSQLLMEMVKYNLPEITEIKAVGYHDFSVRQYPDVALILNATHLSIPDVREVQIEDRLTETMILYIREKIREVKKIRKKRDFCFHNLCHQLFDIDLIFAHPKVSSKEELIEMIVKRMQDKGDVTEQYLASVLEREKATTTSIGHGVAIPHGNMAEINEARIGVAILEQPLDWQGELVEVVFLLGVKMTSNFEIRKTKQFYKDFLVLTENEDNMNALKGMESALDIYQYFIR